MLLQELELLGDGGELLEDGVALAVHALDLAHDLAFFHFALDHGLGAEGIALGSGGALAGGGCGGGDFVVLLVELVEAAFEAFALLGDGVDVGFELRLVLAGLFVGFVETFLGALVLCLTIFPLTFLGGMILEFLVWESSQSICLLRHFSGSVIGSLYVLLHLQYSLALAIIIVACRLRTYY